MIDTNLLINRELGLGNSRYQQNQVIYQLSRSIDLSVSLEFIPQNNGPINCLDIDQSENRYLISGGADGHIIIYDTLENIINAGDEMVHSNTATKYKFNPVAKIKRKNIERPVSLSSNRSDDVNKLFKGVSSVQWFPNDTGMFFTGSVDGSLEIWDTNAEAVTTHFDLEYAINCISYPSLPSSSNAMLVAVASSDQKARLCDIRSKTSAHCLTGHRESILSVKWSPTSPNLIVTGSKDKTIRLWDIRRAKFFLTALDQHKSDLGGVENIGEMDIPAETGQPKYSQRFDNKVKKTSREYSFQVNGEVRTDVPTAHNGFVTSLAWTPDGQYLVSTGNDSKIRLWDMHKAVNTFVEFPKALNNSKTPNQIALSRGDGKYLFHPNGKAIHVYDTLSGRLVNQLKGHFERVNCVIYHPTDEILYSGSNDKLLFAWDNSQNNSQEESTYQTQFEQLKTTLINEHNIPLSMTQDNSNFLLEQELKQKEPTKSTSSTTLPDEDNWD